MASCGAEDPRKAHPHYLQVQLPLEELPVAAAARAAAIAHWLEWKRAAWDLGELGHVQRTRLYKRDAALRTAYSKASDKLLCNKFGYILGQSLAAAHAGPEEMVKHSQLGQGSGGGLV